MSVSGDTIIMRNGRSTSQVSIYNYPEHLNPFYEEDQHKRLRFWHIKKNNDNERWKSISITSLRDLWPLKSLRLGKKKSSTLGINKTSESPPLLRRDDYTFGSPANRNSLQNVHASKRAISMGFERNDQYRSTIQVMGANQTLPLHNKRYIYTRSFTPQPQRSYFMETPTLTRRSGSRTSTTSTNPFGGSDEDEFDDSMSITEQNFGRSHIQTQSLTPAQRKQKRRAPLPAALITKNNDNNNKNNNNNNNNESPKTSHEQTELRIEEDEDLNISNLSSQIQSFVDTSLNIDDHMTSTPIKCNGKATTDSSTPKIVIEHVTTEVDEEEVVEKEKVTTLAIVNEAKNEKFVDLKQQHQQQQQQQQLQEPYVQKQVEPEIAEKQSLKESSKEPTVLIINQVKSSCSSSGSSDKVTVKTPFILTTPPTPEVRETHNNTTEFFLEQPELREIAVLGHLIGPEKPKRSSLTKRTVQFIEMEQDASQEINLINHMKTTNDGHHKDKEVEVKITQTPCEERVEKIADILKIEEPVELRTSSTKTTTTTATTKTTTTATTITNKIEPLKIVESVENIDMPKNHTVQLTTVESTGAIPRTPREWTNSTLAPLPTSVPLEKRKSAKEIIESINRQQRLLKEAAERNLPETKNSISQRLKGVITYNYYAQTATNSNDNNEVDNKISNNLNKNDRREKLQNGHNYGENSLDIDNVASGENVESDQNRNYKRDPHKLENGSPVFAKCRVFKENYPQRESSPTTSNLDWNPLPKPKRNKDINLE